MTVHLLDQPWQRLPMLEADDLLVQQLHHDERSLVAFVAFTPGWSRRRPVSCTADEQFVVLSGTLTLNDVALGPGSLVDVPAGAVRSSTTSEQGCFAVAWFVGTPHWRSEQGASASRPARVVALDDLEGGAEVRLGGATWAVHDSLRGVEAPGTCQLVDLEQPAWTTLAAGVREPVSPHRHLRRTQEEQ